VEAVAAGAEEEDEGPVNVEALKESMRRVTEHLKEELGRVRGGAPSANMLDSLPVEAYGGSAQPLQSLATTALEDGHVLVISPFDPTVRCGARCGCAVRLGRAATGAGVS
jgi:hypothetical protein